jgi:hypothetical protein
MAVKGEVLQHKINEELFFVVMQFKQFALDPFLNAANY